jgi:hypothetical protein
MAFRTASILGVALMQMATAHGAQIGVQQLDGYTLLTLVGPIENGDAQYLSGQLLTIDGSVILTLDSPGGSLLEGIALARLFQKAEISVAVMRGAQCASSCAVAFIGARKRIIQRGASIDVHAPYTQLDKSISAPLEPGIAVTRSASNLRFRIEITKIARENGIDQMVVDLMFRELNPSMVKEIGPDEGAKMGLYTQILE